MAARLLLLQRLLALRDGAGPFTLLLDSLEQPAWPVVDEVLARAKAANTKVVFVAFQSRRRPPAADVFIAAHRLALPALSRDIAAHLPPLAPAAATPRSKTLVVIDSLYHLAATSAPHLTSFLGGLLRPTVYVLATYHTDIPLPVPSTPPTAHNPYTPDPLTTLSYLATAILRVSSLSHVVEKKRARDRSRPEPDFGLDEGRDGVLVGLKGVPTGAGEVVVEMEARRKSGRAVHEVFVLNPSTAHAADAASTGARTAGLGIGGKLCLLEHHPLYAPPSVAGDGSTEQAATASREERGQVETTFSLGLTDKQRRDREGVVLPYFDAQRGEGCGEGGRILYEMDRADDFDEEEDEI